MPNKTFDDFRLSINKAEKEYRRTLNDKQLFREYLEFYQYLSDKIPHRKFGPHEKRLLIKPREGFSEVFGENWVKKPRVTRKKLKELGFT